MEMSYTYIGGRGNSFYRTEDRGLDVMGFTGLGKRIDRLSATRLQASLSSTKYGVRGALGTLTLSFALSHCMAFSIGMAASINRLDRE